MAVIRPTTSYLMEARRDLDNARRQLEVEIRHAISELGGLVAQIAALDSMLEDSVPPFEVLADQPAPGAPGSVANTSTPAF